MCQGSGFNSQYFFFFLYWSLNSWPPYARQALYHLSHISSPKNTKSIPLIPTRLDIFLKAEMTSDGEDVEIVEPCALLGECKSGIATVGNSITALPTIKQNDHLIQQVYFGTKTPKFCKPGLEQNVYTQAYSGVTPNSQKTDTIHVHGWMNS
jgi:hypothetical protein